MRKSIPESQVEQAVREGSFAFKPGSQVTVTDDSGSVFEVPAEEVKTALDQGYRIEKAAERSVREYVDENDSLAGQAKVALGQFADEALFGVPELIYDKTQNPLDVKKKDALKKHFEATNDTFGVLGFGANLALGGPLYKAGSKAGLAAEKAIAAKLSAKGIARGSKSLAKDIVARSAENAAKLGVEGAVVSAPYALTEAALGDPDAAAESLMTNGGIGMALGLTGGPLGKAVSALGKKIGTSKGSELFKELADERAAKALGFSKGQIKKLKGGQKEAESIGNFLMDAKLSDGQNVITPTSSAEDIYDRVLRLRQESGERVGSVYQQLDEKGLAQVKVGSLVDRIESTIGKDFQGEIFSSERGLLNQFINDLKSISYKGDIAVLKADEKKYLEAFEQGATGDFVNFGSVKNYMDRIADIAFPKGLNMGEPSPRQAVARKVWGLLRGEIDSAVDVAVSKTGDDSLKTILDVSRKEYSASSKAKRALEDKISSMAGNKLIGLTDTITGVGAAAVDPITLIPAILAKKTFEKYGNQAGAFLFRSAADSVLMAEKFMDKVKVRLDSIPDILGNRGGPKASTTSESLGAISRLLSEDGESSKKERMAEFNRLQDFVVKAVTNTEKSVAEMSEKLNVLGSGGAPQVGQALNNGLVRGAKYLYDSLPKQSWSANPLNQYKFEPSNQEMSAFERKLSVVIDPFAAIDALADDSLTKDHVEALAMNYPKIYESVRKRVFDFLSDEKPEFPYAKRLNLSLLLGINAEESLSPDYIRSLQDSFAGQASGPAPQQENTRLRVSGLERLNPGEQYETPSQRMLRERKT